MNESPDIQVKKDDETTSNIHFDTLLSTEIGQFGKFQLRVLVLSVIVAIFAGWGTNGFVFTTARINTRCLIPECDGPQPEWAPYWLSNAVPATGLDSYDECQRYGNASALPQQVENNTCPSTLFDSNTLQLCEEYVYETTDSVVYDFGLACDEWRRSLIGTITNIGYIFGLPIIGYISDRWGRRVAVALAAFNTGWIGITRYWSNTYFGFAASQAMETFLGGGSFASSYIMLMEVTGPKYRVAAGAIMNTAASFGFVTLGLIAWVVPNWRNLTLALYVPQMFTIIYFWLQIESVRWYMSKGRFSEALATIQYVAKVNGKQLSEKSIQALHEAALEEAKLKSLEEESKSQEPWLIVQIFKHKPVLLRCIAAPFWWLGSNFIYYGLSINSVNMPGNKYMKYVLVSATEIPGYWIAVFLIGKVGRKPVLIGAFWVCGICQIAYIFIPLDWFVASLTVYLVGKLSISAVLTSSFIYTAELYPTRYRNTLFAYTSMIGTIGTTLAPLTPAIGKQWFEALPFLLYAGFALLSGAVIFLTPETFGTKLPDTLEQASEMGLKTTKLTLNRKSEPVEGIWHIDTNKFN